MPRKTFVAGDVLTAGDVNTFLMDQSVMTFADSAARGSAIGTAIAQEGMLTYLEDTDAFEYWDGSAFTAFGGGIRNPLDTTNTAAGTDALNPSTTGTANTAFGRDALKENTTGDNNVAIGFDAYKANTTGANSVAIGSNAMSVGTAAGSNVAIGESALANNTVGGNTAIGRAAMSANTTGNLNTAVGRSSLNKNTTGANTSALGVFSLNDNTTGSNNTSVGNNSLLVNTTGNENTAVGIGAGDTTTTGNNNSFLGNQARAASATTSNSITLGNSAITSLRCQVTTITALSDKRDKKEIKDLAYGLDLINKVRPVEFTWDTRDGSITDKPDIGFIAQELAEVEDNLNDTDRLRLTLRDNPEKLEATPGRLLPIAIKAIQELSAQNAELLARLEKLENK